VSTGYTAIPAFLISDVWALWRSGLSARVLRMSEIENGKLGLHGTEHSKCNQLVILGFKGLDVTV